MTVGIWDDGVQYTHPDPDGNDSFTGVDGVADTLTRMRGNDTLCGRGGNDNPKGANGNDSLKGATGHDRLDGGAGNDRLNGVADHDRLLGGAATGPASPPRAPLALQCRLGHPLAPFLI